MPAIAKILVVFVGMLLLTRVKVPLGLSLVLGGVALNPWAGRSVAETSESLVVSVCSPNLWLLLAITVMVVEFGRYLTEEENAREVLGFTKKWGGRHGRAASLMAVPSVVGLIPMPGGALFSAPLVEQAAQGTKRPGAWKTAVNYWFRHVWEYWWPLYPGVIVAKFMFAMDDSHFHMTQIPFTVVAFLAGYLFLIRPHAGALSVPEEKHPVNVRRAFLVMLPLAIVVLCVMLMPEALARLLPQLDKRSRGMVAMLAGLIVGGCVIVYDERKRGKHGMFRSLLERKSLAILATILGVMIFQAMLKESGLIKGACEEMQRSNVSLSLVVAGLPFLAGLVTGVAVGFTSASLPLVVALMHSAGADAGLTPMATLALAYGFGYMGMMVSPVHICLVVTRDYFSASFVRVYLRLLPCVLAILAFSVVSHMVFRSLGW